VLTKSNDTLRL